MGELIEGHLKEACQLTSAAWAALADCERGRWFIEGAYHLPKQKRLALENYLSQPGLNEWIESSAPGKVPKPLALSSDLKWGAAQLYAFRPDGGSELVLVGAGYLGPHQKRTWNLFARMLASPPGNEAEEIYAPSMQAELAYDLSRAVDRVLASFVRSVEPQGAWLAIRRGDSLEIAAQRGDPRLLGVSLPLESNRLLRRMHRTLGEVAVSAGQPDWEAIPHDLRKVSAQWVVFPLVIGKRLIGAVGLWTTEDLSLPLIKRLREVAKRVSQPVEVIVTFNELTGHLRRLAMLNDFALAVSSAQDLDQIARRVFGYLERSFQTELIAMYLPSLDGRLVREYRNRDGKFGTQLDALPGHPVGPLLRGRIVRLSEASADFKPSYPAARSTLVVPLRYRSQIIGLLALESTRPDAFSEYDEHLMVVIASHLAGLIEYSRLRGEAEGRARNLGLIHEVVQQVIGLTDKQAVAKITADLLAQYFAYEMAAIMLIGDVLEEPVMGFGGSRAAELERLMTARDFIDGDGMAPRVFNTGQSALTADAVLHKDSGGRGGAAAGSEMCVALKDGDRVLGLIDVQSSQPNAFTNNDLMAMESLAGVLASVVSSANHYERLQETIRQLRVAQVESQARLLAQQEAESRLVQAAKLVAVGEMAAGIAHELNNPLTTVTGFTELILDETPAESPHRPDLEMIQHEALRARGVVRRLLDFARQGERVRAKCDLNEIVDDVLALTKHFIHTSGVQLDAAYQKDLSWVMVDNNQMKQVLLNLVHNAIQAMPTGGTLTIRTGARSKDGRQWAIVTIRDSGIGISPRDMDRIFEPFYTTRGTRGGTGLGLSVTYGIVTDHGGTIEVQSQPGEGSTFTVWLPF